jgi:hypothetical protein
MFLHKFSAKTNDIFLIFTTGLKLPRDGLSMLKIFSFCEIIKSFLMQQQHGPVILLA